MLFILAALFLVFGLPACGMLNYLLRRVAAGRRIVQARGADEFVDIDGILTRIQIKGEGTPLLLIHGSQMNLYDWRFNVDFYCRHFKVYAFDMVGCGYTDKPNADYTPAYFAEFIRKVMDHYAMKRASFVASSWGGGHILHFALIHPQRVNKLILSSPCGLPHKMNLMDAALGIPILGNLIMLFLTKGLLKNQLSFAFEKKELIDTQLIDSVYYPLLTKGAIHSTVTAYRNADFSFVRENLEKIDCPTFIFWGVKDKIHAPWMLDEMQSKISGLTTSIIKNAGHMPHEEASEEFNVTSLEFLLR